MHISLYFIYNNSFSSYILLIPTYTIVVLIITNITLFDIYIINCNTTQVILIENWWNVLYAATLGGLAFTLHCPSRPQHALPPAVPGWLVATDNSTKT